MVEIETMAKTMPETKTMQGTKMVDDGRRDDGSWVGTPPGARASRVPARALPAVAFLAAGCVAAAGTPAAHAAPAGTRAVAAAPGRTAAAHAARPRIGKVIATISIKRIHLKIKVREGVSRRVLSKGVGHYPRTAPPGTLGNTVLLGHRTTWLHPFGALDRLRRGDRIVLKAHHRTYVYRVRGRHIIVPTDRRALEPVPFKPGKAPNGEYITLISCTPKGSDRHRIVVVGKMGK
ncbi:class E sortase [Actinomadura nitritigenes]|uniref:Class E sortase n=3 Tax=Actinomadura nitritigenes TaxID=134602 RepID=A0ABS3QYM2_9ACTN|nr:class E sortase [Actinomadura nitritigenes]MBO2438857.1 class E sortase [Actinomadura nitritigenes]